MALDNFALFILSHGRADRVHTIKTLQKSGYTGDWHIIIDDQDETADQYYERYPGKVIIFDKEAVARETEEGNNFNDRHAIVFARNACFQIAEELGIEYFMQLEDDYLSFRYKFDDEYRYGDWNILDLDTM